MKNYIVLFSCFMFLTLSLKAQEASKYWVFFTDKPHAEKAMKQQDQLLSKKAITRRSKQNIAVDIYDVPVSKSYIDELSNSGVTILRRSRWVNAVSVLATPSQLAELENLPFVKGLRPVARLTMQRAENHFSPLAEANTGIYKTQVSYDYGETLEQIEIHNGELLHQFGFTGTGMTIAVCDGGFNGAEPTGVFSQLHQNGQIVYTQDFVGGGTNVYRAGSHGTRVLSTMAFKSEGLFVGTAPDANFMLFRTENESSETTQEEDNWVAAAELADSLGADVINTSLGYTTFDSGIGNYTYDDMDGRTAIISLGAAMAARKGILVCVSAGNSGSSPWRYISAPADADSILTIGAVSTLGAPAPFSSEGPTADGRLKPNVVSVGVATAVIAGPTGVQRGNGTSFSSPNLCGLVACLWQAFPAKSNIEIIEMVERSSHLFETPNFKEGYGIPDFYKALFEDTVNTTLPIDEIMVFPNPFDAEIRIRYPETEGIELVKAELFTLQAAIVSEWKNIALSRNRFTLPAPPSLASGMYILQVTLSNGEVHTRRLIKQ